MKKLITFTLLAGVLCGLAFFWVRSQSDSSSPENLKLYWFIPDGLRAEPEVFKIYEWAEQGLLPNIKYMMQNGAYGYSIPSFPGHTPVNFATLLTGSTPKVHGVADGPLHVEGAPLGVVSKSGYHSSAKSVPPLTYTLEERNYLVSALSVPGTTPPELNHGITLKGRWGGWGVDFPAMIFQSEKGAPTPRMHQGLSFYTSADYALLGKTQAATEWSLELPKSYSSPQEIKLTNAGLTLWAYIYDSSDDKVENYDRVLFSKDKTTSLADLGVGEWSEWLKDTLLYSAQEMLPIETSYKINVIKLGSKGFYRIRFYYDALNEYSIEPATWYSPLSQSLGPMVDFPDTMPAQLIHFIEDKKTFLDESRMSFEWHQKLAGFSIQKTNSNAIVHNIYTPNQMLTSRWWLGYVDPASQRYHDKSSQEREQLLNEIKEMYKKVDAILGEIIQNADKDTLIVFSSDHGAVPLEKEVRLNNLFAQKGWLKYTFNKSSESYEIDWPNTQVVYLQMNGIYINPEGLRGGYHRARGPAYDRLRDQVGQVLSELTDADGLKPLATLTRWEDAETLDLPKDRVGDLVIANTPGFNWSETISSDHKVFVGSLVSGYKQAVHGETHQGMWTPFLIMGPGIKKNVKLESPIHHIEQYPTILKALKEEVPSFVEGKPLQKILSN